MVDTDKPRGNDVLTRADVKSLASAKSTRDRLCVSIEVRAEIEAMRRIVNGLNLRLERLHELIDATEQA